MEKKEEGEGSFFVAFSSTLDPSSVFASLYEIFGGSKNKNQISSGYLSMNAISNAISKESRENISKMCGKSQ